MTAGDTGAAGTAAKLADSAQPFFGLRDGTYTTTEVRDRNGVIDDPLVPLNTPLEMHMELHAWSETSGDCGNVTVAEHASGRVLDLSIDGAEVRLSIVNAQEGLEDLLSTMTMTPQDDTARPSYSRALENRWAALAGTARHLV